MNDDKWNAKRLVRNARKRELREKQKLENPDYTKIESQKRQERREKQKEQNPDYTKIESQKRQELRQLQKTENPEQHEEFLKSEKQKRNLEKRQIFTQIYDKLFEETKHSFIIPVSKTEWQILKNEELDFIFDERFFPEGNTIADLKNSQKDNIISLRENPYQHCGPSMVFFIKTMVHRPRENIKRKLTKEELEWVFSLDLKNYEKSPKKSYKYSENKKQKNADYYEKTKLNRKTDNLNIRFMQNDPNRVLSVNDITNNPFVSNFPQREAYKINLWKHDKNPEFLEKWKKQRQDYEKVVADLFIEYKEEFLKNKNLKTLNF